MPVASIITSSPGLSGDLGGPAKTALGATYLAITGQTLRGHSPVHKIRTSLRSRAAASMKPCFAMVYYGRRGFVVLYYTRRQDVRWNRMFAAPAEARSPLGAMVVLSCLPSGGPARRPASLAAFGRLTPDSLRTAVAARLDRLGAAPGSWAWPWPGNRRGVFRASPGEPGVPRVTRWPSGGVKRA